MPARAAEHSPLLPRPRQIQYGPHEVRVRGRGVRLPVESTAEDWFAANALSGCLSDRADDPIPVSLGEASHRVIVLKRTAALDPLPIPGEQPGPQSREAY